MVAYPLLLLIEFAPTPKDLVEIDRMPVTCEASRTYTCSMNGAYLRRVPKERSAECPVFAREKPKDMKMNMQISVEAVCETRPT
jgi:hypothetical protein